jgi:hypothetical protein
MSLKDIQSIASSEIVFAILFIGLFWLVLVQMQRSLTEQREREDQIMEMYRNREADLKDQADKSSESYTELLALQRNDSLNRERELMLANERLIDSQKAISATLTRIQDNLLKLEEKVDKSVTELWKEHARNKK